MYDGEVACDVPDCGVELMATYCLLLYFSPKEGETKTSLELQVLISLFYTKDRYFHNSQSTDEQQASKRKHDGVPSEEKQSHGESVLIPHWPVV